MPNPPSPDHAGDFGEKFGSIPPQCILDAERAEPYVSDDFRVAAAGFASYVEASFAEAGFTVNDWWDEDPEDPKHVSVVHSNDEVNAVDGLLHDFECTTERRFINTNGHVRVVVHVEVRYYKPSSYAPAFSYDIDSRKGEIRGRWKTVSEIDEPSFVLVSIARARKYLGELLQPYLVVARERAQE